MLCAVKAVWAMWVRYDVSQWLFICYVYMFWLADEDVSIMRWDEEDSKVMEVCEGHVYEGVRVSMGMDSSEVIEYAGWNEYHLTWWICCVGHECMGPKKKITGTEVIWVMIAWLNAIGYIMQWVVARLLHGCIAGVHATEHPSQVMSITCAISCTAILLFYAMIFQAYVMLMCIRGVCSSEDLYDFVTDTAVTPNVIIAPPIPFPLLCFIHVFIRFCLCLAGSIRNRGDGEMCRTVFLPLNQIPYVLHVYFIVTVIVEELIGFRRICSIFRNTNSVF